MKKPPETYSRKGKRIPALIAKTIAKDKNYDGIAIIGVNFKSGDFWTTSYGTNFPNSELMRIFTNNIHAEIESGNTELF